VKAQGELADPMMWFEILVKREVELENEDWEGMLEYFWATAAAMLISPASKGPPDPRPV
jgi:hypothetical protein